MKVVKKKNKDKKSLFDRMKRYEKVTSFYLIPKQPVIVKLNGINTNFDSYNTKQFISILQEAALKICDCFSNISFVYIQRDEISFLLKDYDSREQQQLFNGNIQRIVSSFTSKLTAHSNFFTSESFCVFEFECKVFNIPPHEVINYFICRQDECYRNSVNEFAQLYYSREQLFGLKTNEVFKLIETTYQKKWAGVSTELKYGSCIKKEEIELKTELTASQKEFTTENWVAPVIKRKKWMVDNRPPLFVDHKEYIEQIVLPNAL